LAAGPLIDRYGSKLATCSGGLACGLGLAGVTIADSYPALAAWMFALGLGGSLVSTGANTLIADVNPENSPSALNMGHAFFGVGAVFFPLLVTLALSRFGTLAATRFTALLMFSLTAFAASQELTDRHCGGEFDWRAVRQLTLHPVILILAGVVFLTSALAIAIAGWLRLYSERDFHTSGQLSGMILVLFWVLAAVGRFASSRGLRFLASSWLVLTCSVGMVFGLVLLVTAHNTGMLVWGVVVCGLSYGPIYPTTIGVASAQFPGYRGTVFGTLQAAGLIGGALIPASVGWVAGLATLRAGLWLLVVVAGLLAFLQASFMVRYRGPSARAAEHSVKLM
jgi:fucose permease